VAPERSSEETPEAELRRIDFTGTVWFAACLLATSIPLGALLSAGWRPGDLAGDLAVLWWSGAVLIVAGLAGLVWAGCPVLGFPIEVADSQKRFTMRGGIVIYGIGSVASVLAVLLS
jgi:hypothetical protein